MIQLQPLLKKFIRTRPAAFLRNFFALLFLSFLFACSDEGCIDADDFGEYESQTLTIKANAASESCTYDSTLEITDSSQGSGIKSCLISGNSTVIDETNTTYTSGTNGCNGFTDSKIQSLCISDCVQSCLANAGGNSTSSEPNWTSTDQKESGVNSGVTIYPGSQVVIRATGSVILGDTADYPDIAIQADNGFPHSKDSNWDDNFFDVKSGQTISLSFSGWWDSDTGSSSSYDNFGAGGNTLATMESAGTTYKLYNGARRAVIYRIDHPDGYDFDTTAGSEKSGTIDVPLLPDPIAWTCDYTGSTTTESDCYNSTTGYTNNGYTNANDSLAISAYPITSDSESSYLGTFGGMIRWDDDGLNDNSYDPFSSGSYSCGNSGCTVSSVDSEEGQILGDISSSSGASFTKTYGNAYKVSFKLLDSSASSSCSTLTANITNSDGTVTYYTFSNLSLSTSSWTSDHITLESGNKLVIAQNSGTYSSGGNNINCGNAIAMRTTKYHEITIAQSGFVKFTMLNGLSGSCSIKARIVNPEGSLADFSVDADDGGNPTTYDTDFYEYDDFAAYGNTSDISDDSSTDSSDPLYNLTVSPSTSASQVWTDSVFVRKGQVIRFSPESWNGTWTTYGSLSRKCGIGMAMHINPRPALLCRGQSSSSSPEYVANPNCIADYETNTGTLLGCKAYASNCYDSADTTYYCPVSECQYAINGCTNGESPTYQKTGCSNSGSLNGTCTYSTGYSASTCNNCTNLMVSKALLAAKVNLSYLDQCYDLENYTGKVANIPSATGFSSDELAESSVAKGATKLGTFNGDYGNLEGFADSGSTDSSTANEIFSVNSSITFSNAGRLRFFMLDSSSSYKDFRDLESSYDNNSDEGSSYSGANGFKINFSGALEFTNGEWLQVKLCKETDDDNRECESVDVTDSIADNSKITDQPEIIEIDESQSTESSPYITSGYKFDAYGNITRTTSASTNDCTLDDQGLATEIGSVFYCHTYPTDYDYSASTQTDTVNDNVKRLRITFKILDPETGNCHIPASATDSDTDYDGIKTDNPYYDSSTSSNVGAICDDNEYPVSSDDLPSGGSQCTKEFYCANKYSNNSGEYYVNVKVKKLSSSSISNVIGGVITPVIEVMDGKSDGSTVGQAERLYKLLITDSRYEAILTMCLVVMYTFYGFGYLMGVSELNSAELINRVIKIGLIYLFVSETGWDWFNDIVVTFFKDGTDYLAFLMASSFDSSAELQSAIANSDYYDKSILFSSVDKVFNMFFSDAVQKKISALLFASIFGWAYCLIIWSSFVLYVYSVAYAVLLYLTAQIFISLLFTLGPIFFIFTLFAQTKDMFDNWLKQLIGLSLQQIFLLTTLAFFNMLMYEVIKMALGYKICWDEVWTINIITRITLMSFWTIASLPPRTNAQSEVGNIGNPDGIPSLFTILYIWVIASLMRNFIGFMTDLAASLGGSMKASSLGSGLKSAADNLQKYASEQKGKIWKATGKKAIDSIDDKIFDSGAIADKRRAKIKAQNKKDRKDKNAMAKSADKAEQNYMKNNGAEYMNMSAEDRKKKIAEVRTGAMKKEGEKRGLDEKEITRLMNDKGKQNFTGSTVGGYLADRAKQSMGRHSTMKQSLAEQNEGSKHLKMNASTAREAMKKMTSDERKKFQEQIKKGEINVRASGKIEQMKHAHKFKDFKEEFTAGMEKYVPSAEYDNARKELEKEGEISQRRFAEFARDPEEKKLIRERMEENKKQKKIDEFKGSSTPETIANVEMEAQIQEDLQQDAETDYVRSKDSTLGKIIGRRKSTKNFLRSHNEELGLPMKNQFRDPAHAAELEHTMNDSKQDFYDDQLGEALEKQEKLQDAESLAQDELRKAHDTGSEKDKEMASADLHRAKSAITHNQEKIKTLREKHNAKEKSPAPTPPQPEPVPVPPPPPPPPPTPPNPDDGQSSQEESSEGGSQDGDESSDDGSGSEGGSGSQDGDGQGGQGGSGGSA